MNKKILARFDELEKEIQVIMNTSGGTDHIDQQLFNEWYLKVRNLLILCTGNDSMYSKEFIIHPSSIVYSTNLKILKGLQPIFKAAKNDYENGFLDSLRSLITAEVFDNELEQAQELLDSKYHVAAAVIAGTVLETALRELCDSQIPPIGNGKLDKMNADLKKAGVYNQLQSKRITALADIRNSAAHGKSTEFNHDDVSLMIRDIENFLASHLSD